MDFGDLVVALLLLVVIIGLFIYLFVKVISIEKNLSTSVAEIKSKIGSIIRQINQVNKLEYKVDVNQQKDINKLKDKAFIY